MSDHALALSRAFEAAFQPHVRARLSELGVDVDEEMASRLTEASDWLVGELEALLTVPFARQPRGPLELFQEAVRFPTDLLQSRGLAPIGRDEAVVAALPGDLYGLAPASSSELGEEAWTAHLAWGAEKAAALTAAATPRGRVVVVTRNLMDRSRVEDAARRASLSFGVFRSIEELEDAIRAEEIRALVVDLEHPHAAEVVELGTASELRVVCFGPHVETERLQAVRGTGASAMPRSRFFHDLDVLMRGW